MTRTLAILSLLLVTTVARADEDPTQFLLVEVYRTAEDPARHKATTHYATWRDAVEPMMTEPRRSTKYHALSPVA